MTIKLALTKKTKIMNLYNNASTLTELVHKLPESNIKEQLFKEIKNLEDDIHTQKEYVGKFLDEARKELNNNRAI